MSNRWERVIVTPSCGCVLCDLEFAPTTVEGKRVHRVAGANGTVPCTKQK
jgi:hypothetical protein